MTDKILKIAIAGYGVVGERRHHYLNKHPNTEVVAICDNKFGENKPKINGVQVFKTPMEIFDNVQVDALFVCLPNEIAPEVTIEALNRQMHVFCEKPPGRTLTDIRNVIEAEQSNPSLKLKYGFNHRYHDSIKKSLEIIKSGELGQVLNMRGTYGKSAFIPWPRPSAEYLGYSGSKYWRTSREVAGGGILLDQGIHMVDLMRTFGGEFSNVKSIVKNDYWNHDVEDNAYALMTNETGVVAFLHSTATQWRHRFSLEVHLSEGALILEGILSGSRSYGQEKLTVVYRQDEDNGNPQEQSTTYIKDNSWWEEICEFVDSVLYDKKISVGTSYDALKSMELVYSIYCGDEDWEKKYDIKRAMG